MQNNQQPKRLPGRPTGIKASEHIHIKVTPELKAYIKQQGGSKWIKQLIEAARLTPCKPTP